MASNPKPAGKGPKKGGKGGGGGGGGKDGKGGGGSYVYQSKRQVGGKGIFVTCVRGKEARCVSEMYDVLNEVADRLYPPERIAQMQAKREEERLARLAEKGESVEAEMKDDDEEATPAPEQAPSPSPAPDDFDDEMERELAELRSATRGKTAPSKGGPDAKGKAKEKPRFQSVATDTECLCFFATAWPYDPVELTEAIVSDVQATGITNTRFTQRLSPISFSCHSLSLDQVESQSARHLEQAFVAWAKANNTTSITYQIEPSLRSHTQPLSRAVLLPLLGGHITSLALPPPVPAPVIAPSPALDADSTSPSASETPSAPAAVPYTSLFSTLPDRPLLTTKADLKNPDLVVLPTVLKNVFGLSVVEGKMWRGKKFNLEAIATEVRHRRLREEEAEKALLKGETEKKDVEVAKEVAPLAVDETKAFVAE